MNNVLAVMAGGAMGALLRYFVGIAVASNWSGDLPLGTLTVNLIGSLVIGLLWGMLDTEALSPTLKSLIFIGLLGSFTTFSTFSWENYMLFKNGFYALAVVNVIGSVVGGLLLVWGGFWMGSKLMPGG